MGQNGTKNPETRKVRILDGVFQDLKQTIHFIAITSGQPLNAKKVSGAIAAAIQRIAVAPFAFKECEQLPTKSKIYRQAACLSYLIIYKVTKTEIIILKIIHSARKSTEIRKLRGNH